MSRGAAAAVQCGQQLKTGTHTLSSHVFVSGERKDSDSESDSDADWQQKTRSRQLVCIE